MLLAAFFFAIMGVLAKIGSAKFTSAELVFYRSFFGLAFIFVLVRKQQLQLRTPLPGKQFARATLGAISLVMFFYAVGELPLATAMTLNYTSPLFMALFASLILTRRWPGKPLLLAIVLGFIGVALLLQPSLHVDELFAGTIALISGLLAGMVYVLVTMLARAGEPDWRTVFYFTLVSTVGAGGWMLWHHLTVPSWSDIPLLLGLGAAATIAQLAMTRAYRTGNHLVVGSLAYTTVLLASIFGIILWGEVLSADRWFAVMLIVLGGIISIRAAPRQ